MMWKFRLKKPKGLEESDRVKTAFGSVSIIFFYEKNFVKTRIQS